MKTLIVAAGATLFACNLNGFAQSTVGCGQTLDAPARSRAVLKIDSLSAGIEVVGTDNMVIHVSCTAEDPDVARNVRLQLSGTSTDAMLKITGDDVNHNNIQIRIEVPHKMSVGVRMRAGDVKVEDVAGDKDISLYAGRITVSSTQEWNYRSVDASVDIGAVNAPVYGSTKGGFFRSVKRRTADGEYRLYAHVMTGEIDLQGKNSHPTTD